MKKAMLALVLLIAGCDRFKAYDAPPPPPPGFKIDDARSQKGGWSIREMKEGERVGRYQMLPVTFTGITEVWRLDTSTGKVARCILDEGKVTCWE